MDYGVFWIIGIFAAIMLFGVLIEEVNKER